MIDKNIKQWIRDEVFRQAPVNICVIGRDYSIIESNENFTRTFGDSSGKRCYQAYKGRDEKCPDCNLEKTFSDGRVRSGREYGIDRHGRKIHYMVQMAPLIEKDGSIPYVIEMSTDITSTRSVDNYLRQEQEHYRLLFDEVPCFISIQDRDLIIIEANRLFKEYFGEDCLGKQCYEVYKHRSEQCYPCIVLKTFEDGEVHRNEEVVTSRDGTKVNVIVYTAPIRNHKGEITGVMEMATDITQIRQLQSQLTSIGLLVGSISHGVKGLLMGLDGGIYAVETGFEKGNDERVKKGWEMVKRNVNKIRSLVLDILYYAKDREPEWESIDALEMGMELELLMDSRAKATGTKFETHFDPNAGSFEADQKAVRTLIVNILENAFDACRVDADKEKHRVDFRIMDEGDTVAFHIIDNGIGMDRETKEKLFTLFFSSKGTGGTGLGLFISNKIVQQHGGSISVESTPGEGSTFTVRLPRKKEKKDKTNTAAAQ